MAMKHCVTWFAIFAGIPAYLGDSSAQESCPNAACSSDVQATSPQARGMVQVSDLAIEKATVEPEAETEKAEAGRDETEQAPCTTLGCYNSKQLPTCGCRSSAFPEGTLLSIDGEDGTHKGTVKVTKSWDSSRSKFPQCNGKGATVNFVPEGKYTKCSAGDVITVQTPEAAASEIAEKLKKASQDVVTAAVAELSSDAIETLKAALDEKTAPAPAPESQESCTTLGCYNSKQLPTCGCRSSAFPEGTVLSIDGEDGTHRGTVKVTKSWDSSRSKFPQCNGKGATVNFVPEGTYTKCSAGDVITVQ